MANEEHLAILRRGFEAWNRWQLKAILKPDLSDASLENANLQSFNFAETDLSGANLCGAILVDSDFWAATLTGADLRGSSPAGARFRHTNLTDVDFTASDLSFVDFSLATLDGDIFDSAQIEQTVFADNDLSTVTGLETVLHGGPSFIGIETIYKSRETIPEGFLRSCGVPESFITQIHSLVGAEDGIQFYSCFISYSSKDEKFARRLHGRMRDAHLRVWFAPEDIQGDKKLHEQIETAIRVYDKLLIVLSEASLQSDWVMTELRKAFKAERESGKRKLFPVRLISYETLQKWECWDSTSGKDLAEEVRQYFIPDFSNWKDHDQFETNFARLLKDLKTDADIEPAK